MEEKFKEINQANEILSDKKKKYIFDIKGVEGLRKLDPHGGQQEMDVFSSFFGGGFGGGNSLQQGQDLQLQFSVSLEDIYNGREQQLQFNKRTVCTHCKGSGALDGKTTTCTKCKGKGVIISTQNMGYSVIQ